MQATVISPRRGQAVSTTEINDAKVNHVKLQEEVKREKTRSSLSFDTLPKKLARSELFRRNHTVGALFDHFKLNRLMWHVDLFFQYAEGGPLYVDEPRHPFNVEQCRQKQKVMRKAGLRYCFLEKNTKFDEALLQIEGKI